MFEPTERQRLYFDAMMLEEGAEVGFGGGRYGGKSKGISWVAFELCVRYPGTEGAIFRQDSVDLVRSTMQSFKDFMAKHNPTVPISWHMSSPIYCDLYIQEPRASRIYWMDAKDPADVQSLNLHWAQVDEATETNEEFFLMLEGSVGRCVLPDGRRPNRKIGWGANPGPGWCKKKFPVGKSAGRFKVDLGEGQTVWRFFIPAWVKDNKYADPQFEAFIRATYPDSWVRRWLEGDWSVFEGQIYTEFDPQHHVYGPTSGNRAHYVASGMRNMVVLDWGFRVPTACLLVSIDYDGHFWIMREYRASERTPSQHKPHIELLTEGTDIQRWKMDFAAVDQSSGVKLWQQFRDIGLPFTGCAKKNKTGPDNTVLFYKQILRENRVHIHESCAGLIAETTNARWKPQSASQAALSSPKDEPLDIDDHSLDALFMALEEYRQKPVKPTEEQANEMRKHERGRLQAQDDVSNRILDPDAMDGDGRFQPMRGNDGGPYGL